MKSLGGSRGQNGLNTTREQSAFTIWELSFRQSVLNGRFLKNRDANGTKTPKQTLLRMLLVSLTATEKKIQGKAFTNPLKMGRGKRKNDSKEGSE